MNEILSLPEVIAGGVFGAGVASAFLFIIFSFLFIILLISAIVYVYKALAWSTIAKKLKYDKPWLAWIPLAQFFLLPILAKKHWSWGFIVFVPFVVYPMTIIPIIGTMFLSLAMLFLLGMKIYWCWFIFERRRYAGWISVLQAIPLAGDLLYLIMIGVVAWSDKPVIMSEHAKKSKKSSRKK